MNEIGTVYLGQCSASAIRVSDGRPVGIRWGRKPNGELVLQAAYLYQEGCNGGVEWGDVEIVELPE